jgi:hypothetical protein
MSSAAIIRRGRLPRPVAEFAIGAVLAACGAGGEDLIPHDAGIEASGAHTPLDECARDSLLAPTLFGTSECAPRPMPDASTDGEAPDEDAGAEDAATPIVNECDPPTSGPTMHITSIVSDETWTADGSPHLVMGTLGVSATLTVEPCAEVLLGPLDQLQVSTGGKILAEGAATRPIHFGALDPAEPFASISASGGGTIHLAHVTVDGGGDPQNSPPDTWGMFYLQGEDQTQPTQATLFVDHVTIAGSESNGLQIQDGAGFAPGSTDLVVVDSAQYPISITPRALGTIPAGEYAGNGVDEILLPGIGGAGAVQDGETTMYNRGVPYQVGNSLTSGLLLVEAQAAGSVATLTIEPGVEVRFKPDGVLQVETFVGSDPARGALVAVGTPEAPIVFTSDAPTPAAGHWLGIWFGEIPDASNKIEHARVEYAGGLSSSGSGACNIPGTNDAAIRIFGLPAGQFVTHTTISDSAGHGVDRGWRDDLKPDFLPTNTFTRIANCKQSYPGDAVGACPDPVPCP